MTWFDTPINSSNFFRWSDAEGRALSDIQRPELYEVGFKGNSNYPTYNKETYDNKNNFFRWIDLNNIQLNQLQELGEVPQPQIVTGLTATASGNTVTLNWVDRGTDEIYRVARSLNGVSFTIISNDATPPFENYGLSFNTLYYYRIISTIGNTSVISNAVQVTTGNIVVTEWSQIGNSLATGNPGQIAALTSSRVGLITNSNIIAYDFDGTDWSQTGSAASVTFNNTRITKLTSSRVALTDTINDKIYTYTFNGSTWSQVGNASPVINATGVHWIAGLSSSRVCVYTSVLAQLRTYDFDGTDWAQVGNSFTISGGAISQVALCALSSNRVVYSDPGIGLTTYEFDGTDWTKIGNESSVVNNGNASTTALSSNIIAFIDEGDDELRAYEFDETDWIETGTPFSLTNSNPYITTLLSNQIAFIEATGSLRTYGY